MSNTFDKLSILDSFIEEVNSYLPEIETNLERLAQLPSDMEALEETYRRTHTIGGSASMMDFPGLAHVAHGMEDILGDVLDGLTALDAPTQGLLQRSFTRMRVLLQGIRGGVDENAIIAEDDADYVQYRTYMDAAAQAAHSNGTSAEQSQVVSEPLAASASLPSLSSMPSLDEVLASFHTPPVTDDGVDWPEETIHTAPHEAAHVQESPTNVAMPSENNHQFQSANPSALEMLASAAHSTFSQEVLPATPTPRLPIEDGIESIEQAGQAGQAGQPVFHEASTRGRCTFSTHPAGAPACYIWLIRGCLCSSVQ